jgi:ribonuclease HII
VTESIIVALITGGLSLAGVVVTCMATAKKNENALKTSQAVTETKLEELTREVRAHNNFAQRMPVVEEQIKVINHRLSDLEQFHR